MIKIYFLFIHIYIFYNKLLINFYEITFAGQLGIGDTKRRDEPTEVTALKGHTVIGASCGRNHTLFLTSRGIVFAAGDNKLGQCGVGKSDACIISATKVKYSGPPIVKVGCGAEFSMILDIKGGLHSFGSPEYGALGHNTDGKYFITNTKMAFHFEKVPKRIVLYIERAKDGHVTPLDRVEITDFSCGHYHTVAIDSKNRAFSWGFGGIGRLGHNEQRDELVPRLIKFLEPPSRGVRAVYCGSTYSIAINVHGSALMFGQTKRTGEANMYPKPIQDLSGWEIRCVGCSQTSVVVAADDSVIAWGASPTFGELVNNCIMNKSFNRLLQTSKLNSSSSINNYRVSVKCVNLQLLRWK